MTRKCRELHELNKIGVALSAQRDIGKLLDLILAKSREITVADAGSLYLVERGKEGEGEAAAQLRFKLTQNDSLSVPFSEFCMPLTETSIAGYAALTRRSVNVADAYDLPAGSPYAGSGGAARAFDVKSGYRTKSMLVVPMTDHHGEVIGVVHLINKKRDPKLVLRPLSLVEETVIPFTAVDEELSHAYGITPTGAVLMRPDGFVGKGQCGVIQRQSAQVHRGQVCGGIRRGAPGGRRGGLLQVGHGITAEMIGDECILLGGKGLVDDWRMIRGSSLGFLIFNFYPSMVMAGTVGSMFMGFALAFLAIFAGTTIATAILVMALPMIDFVWVIGERFKKRKSMFKPDRSHLHHKLLELGWSQRKIALHYYAVTAMIAIIALNTRVIEKSITLIATVVIMAIALIFINKKLANKNQAAR